MTKINLTKAALLAATALLGATSVQAQVADNWDIGGDVGITATNGGDVVLDASVAGGIQAPEITDGYKNSISSAAVGSSASSSFTAFNNSANASSAIVAYEGGVNAVSFNGGGVSNLNDLATSVTIGGGTGNSISVAGVGSSASGSATFTAAAGTELSEASYSVGGDVVIQNGDGATVGATLDATTGGNGGDVLVALATGMATPSIGGGDSNSISAAGVGSSASFSLTNNTIDADSVITTQTLALGGAVTVTSSNTGGIVVGGGTDGTTNAQIDTAGIAGGNANSISTAGVGSSASFSFANNTYNGASGSAAAALSVGDVITVASLNDGGGVTVQADLSTETNIDGGNANSISVAGVGSSGSVSFSNSIFGDTAGPATVGIELADISVSSQSTGDIAVLGSITDTATIGGGSNNSISLAGVGASASTSFTTTSYAEAGTGASATTGTVGGITLAALNAGGVSVTTGINTPTIAAGYNNSISAAAVGASASQSMTQNILAPGL